MHINRSLQKILTELPEPIIRSDISDIQITGLSVDSQSVQPGHLFFAMKGGTYDGHDYIQDALDKGAVAVVGQHDPARLSVPFIGIEHPRRALTWISAGFYDWPGRKLTVVGVTGTDGKTTTCNLIYHILVAAGIRTGMISTVNAMIADEVLDTGFHVTTPDAHDLQRYLAKMVSAGLTHVVLETTSHGWAQYRVDACEFDIGVVTNITHEHLDEHGEFETYRAAKARLLSSLEWTSNKKHGNPRLGVLNYDDQSFGYLSKFLNVNSINYGLDDDAEIRAVDREIHSDGIQFVAESATYREMIKSNLIGAFNISNCLAALAATVHGLGIEPQTAAQGIAATPGIPGRMERIDMGQDFTAIVDFAHTPNALKVTLEAARIMTAGKVIVVFGSAGLRDKQKRRMMAQISAEMADLTVLTAEDPRTESLADILDEMAAGAKSKGGRDGKTFWRVPDRGQAIKYGLSLANSGDILLACGKGHEQSMCFGAVEHPWDDCIAMRAALADYLGIEGPEMPYLPTQDTLEEHWLKLR
ncbi:MAG: UDP-N-acetylmuramoyl-L-alanyl-D-glutamate--2,6-diaminopimelate ligase [Anaerolineae bacterium]|nr:UDP-N-acetylmuramoyl-L-alanyl-D-glutamate--2,6-diaminopimelate ligase [Anaerolineae bacterium]